MSVGLDISAQLRKVTGNNDSNKTKQRTYNMFHEVMLSFCVARAFLGRLGDGYLSFPTSHTNLARLKPDPY